MKSRLKWMVNVGACRLTPTFMLRSDGAARVQEINTKAHALVGVMSSSSDEEGSN